MGLECLVERVAGISKKKIIWQKQRRELRKKSRRLGFRLEWGKVALAQEREMVSGSRYVGLGFE
jgi:hypothetical protein